MEVYTPFRLRSVVYPSNQSAHSIIVHDAVTGTDTMNILWILTDFADKDNACGSGAAGYAKFVDLLFTGSTLRPRNLVAPMQGVNLVPVAVIWYCPQIEV